MSDEIDLEGPLGETVRQIRASASAEVAEQRITQAVLARQGQHPPARLGLRWAGAIAAILVVALALWAAWYGLLRSRLNPPTQIAAAPGIQPTPPSVPGGRGTMPAASPPNGRGANVPRGMGAAAVTNFTAVAANARVLVANGPDTPLRLGGALQAGGTNLHVWTWKDDDVASLQSESRVLPATHSGRLALTPDGKLIATSDGRIIGVASGQAKPIPGFNGRIKGLFFSPDGTALLFFIADDGPVTATLRMVEFPSGKQRFELKGMFGATSNAAFSPDGKQLFIMHPGFGVYQHDAITGEERFGYEPALSNSLRAIAVSPDGKLLAAAASRDQTQVWEVATGKLLHKLSPRQNPRTYENGGIEGLLFSPDGKYLAATGISQALLWDLSTGEAAQVYATGTGGGSALRFYDAKTLTSVSDFRSTQTQEGAMYLALPAVRLLTLPAATQPR